MSVRTCLDISALAKANVVTSAIDFLVLYVRHEKKEKVYDEAAAASFHAQSDIKDFCFPPFHTALPPSCQHLSADSVVLLFFPPLCWRAALSFNYLFNMQWILWRTRHEQGKVLGLSSSLTTETLFWKWGIENHVSTKTTSQIKALNHVVVFIFRDTDRAISVPQHFTSFKFVLTRDVFSCLAYVCVFNWKNAKFFSRFLFLFFFFWSFCSLFSEGINFNVTQTINTMKLWILWGSGLNLYFLYSKYTQYTKY